MCNVVLILIIGILFLGCANKSVAVTDRTPTEYQTEKEVSKKYIAGCFRLKNGYLVCPKKR